MAVSETLEKYFIVRIAWVFGLNGKNFIKTMLNVGKTHDTVRVVNDQIGTPTYTYDLAAPAGGHDRNAISTATITPPTRAVTSPGTILPARSSVRQAMSTKVIPVTTEEYGLSKAARPFNSRLDKHKLVENGFQPLPSWQDALSRYLIEIGVNQ